MNFILILLIVGAVFYIIDLAMNPEKHIIGLVFFAIIYAIFDSFYESTGAKSDYDRKKRG